MHQYFIARQPIFDSNLKLCAYELLFRDSMQNAAPQSFCEDTATAEVLTTSADIGLDGLVGEQLAFINLPLRFFLEPELLLLPPDRVVLEVLENVEITDAVRDGVKTLRDRGFTLALDDIVDIAPYGDVLPHISIVKLEIPRLDRTQWGPIISGLQQQGFKVLAEKVETNDEFEELASLGCDYFQGYFFAKPKLVSGRRLSASKLGLLQLMVKINDPEIDIDTLSELVSRDVTLSVRVLNHVNSAASHLNRHVDSVREGVVYLGRQAIRNIVTLLTMSSIDDHPVELVAMALRRGRFCELYAERLDVDDAPSYFTVGLFSVLDALMDAPMEEVVEKFALSEEMRKALVLFEGSKGAPLQIARDLERADTSQLRAAALPGEDLTELYREATLWSDAIVSGAGTT